MKLDELRARLRASASRPELDKPPLGKIPYCAGCMKRLDKCDALVTCKGFLSGEQVEMLDVGVEVLERMRSDAPDERELIVKAALDGGLADELKTFFDDEAAHPLTIDDLVSEPMTDEDRAELRSWYRDDLELEDEHEEDDK